MEHLKIYNKVVEKVTSYHPSPNIDLIKKAYDFALEAHGDQFRKSGEPYIIHPLEVALILANLQLDCESIISGILHDVIEDTEYTYDDLANMFSPEIAELVDGVTKLDKLEYSSKEEHTAETYRKMFLAMAKDIRVILIKIADRLHNMRTLKFMSRKSQIEKAQETKDIYAPIAHKLGISKIKNELEDLSFRYLEPDEYFKIASEVKLRQIERQAFVNKILIELDGYFKDANIKFELAGRPKHFYSIYKKMQSKNLTLDSIYDLFAVRVLVDTVADCYNVLGICNTAFKSINGRFKDYISVPKDNGYQSLHNTLIGPDGEFFEIQIRTFDMHKTSEYGVAAHFKYKGVKSGSFKEEEKMLWLKQTLELQKDLDDNTEYLSAIKGDFDLYEDRVYCFTPSGEPINLAKGSTPIDFAYAIHSEVGNKMVGAKVNGRIVPYEYVLKNTDRVEIKTSKSSTGPSLDWLNIAKSNQAKNKINQWIKNANKSENIIKGKELIEKEIKIKGYVYAELVTPKSEKEISLKFRFKDYNTLCAAVGRAGLKDGYVVNKFIELYELEHKEEILQKKKSQSIDEIQKEINSVSKPNNKKTKGVMLKGSGFTPAIFSRCCSPLPGDEIVAFTTRGRGSTVHKSDCINIINLPEVEKNRVINATWPQDYTSKYAANLQIKSNHNDSIFMNVSKIIMDEKLSIENMNTRKNNMEIIVDVEIIIESIEQLELIKRKLLNISSVVSVSRITT